MHPRSRAHTGTRSGYSTGYTQDKPAPGTRYPADVSHTGVPGGPHPSFQPGAPFARRVRKVGAPLGVLIALGTLAGVIVIVLTAVNPVGTSIGFVLSSSAMTIVVLCYLWLDRWEPEPPRLLVFAFVWGTSAAVVIASVLQIVLEAWINSAGSDDISPITLVAGAPLTEEAAKGLFLLLMMTGVRRNELNSLTDCLVYAGLVGAGFAWLEDILYIANGESLADSLLTAALRLIMSPFAHSLFTTMTAIGVWFALHRRTALGKVGSLLLGYTGAVVLHAMWNGSSLLGAGAYLGLYVFWMMPVFALAVALAVHSRRSEQRIVAAKLPGMVAAGVVSRQRGHLAGIDPVPQAGDRRGEAVRRQARRGGGEAVRRTGGRVGLRP